MIPPEDCPTRHVIKLFGSQWKMEGLWFLREGTKRYNELEALIEGISPRMLTQSLRQLERDGLVKRTQFSEIPPRVEYELMPLADSLKNIIDQMVAWWVEHRTEVEGFRVKFDSMKKK